MLNATIIDDPRVQRLPPSIFRTWINLSLLIEPGGLLPEPTEAAWRLRVGINQFLRHLEILRDRGLIATNGDNRLRLVPLADVVYQEPLDDANRRASNAERQRLYRLRKKGIVTSPVTDSVTSPVTDSVTSPVTDSVTSPVTDSVTSPVTDSVTSPVTLGGKGGSNLIFLEKNQHSNCSGSDQDIQDSPPTPPHPVTSVTSVTVTPNVTSVTSVTSVTPKKISDVCNFAQTPQLRAALADWFQYQIDQRHRRKQPQGRELEAIGREIQHLIETLGEPALVQAIDHSIASGYKAIVPKGKAAPPAPPPDPSQRLREAQRAYKEANVAAIQAGKDLVDPAKYGLTPDGTALLLEQSNGTVERHD